MKPQRSKIAASLSYVIIALVCLLPVVFPPHIYTPLRLQAIQHEIDNAFTSPLPTSVYGIFKLNSDDNGEGRRSTLSVYEGESPLGPAHSLHDVIRTKGAGAFSHWGGHIYFSTSDNTDPRTNGRSYSVRARAALPWWLTIVLVAGSLAGILAARNQLKKLAPGPATVARRGHLHGGLRAFLALSVPLLAFGIALIASPQYKTNDDVFMRLIAEGFTAKATETQFLIFQNVLAGSGLSFFYRWMPALPWYDIELATAAFLGAVLSLVAILRVCRTLQLALLCSVVVVIALLAIFPFFQFTASAMVLAGGGLLLIISYWRWPPQRSRSLSIVYLIGGSAFLMASLIRFEAAVLMMFIVGPAALGAGLFTITMKRYVGFAVAMTCLLGLGFALKAFDRAYYSHHAGWESFHRDAELRGRATEYAHVDRSQRDQFHSALSAAAWTETDYGLLTNWLFSNQDLFSAARMKAFLAVMPTKPMRDRVSEFHQQLTASQNASTVVVLLIGLTPLLLLRTVPSFLMASAACAWLYVILLAIGIFLKPHMSHIVIPIYAVWTLTMLLVLMGHRERPPLRQFDILENRIIAGMVFVALSILAVQQVRSAFSSGSAANVMRESVYEDTAIWPVPAQATVVVWDHNFPYEMWARPFVPIPRVSFRLFHTGTNTVTPLVAEFYDVWGTNDLGWVMCSRPDVYRVDGRLGYAERHADLLRSYMREHYNQAVAVKSVFEGKVLSLYTCRKEGG